MVNPVVSRTLTCLLTCCRTVYDTPSPDQNTLAISTLPNSCKTKDGGKRLRHSFRENSYTCLNIASSLLFDVETFIVQLGLSAIPQGTRGTGTNPNTVLPSTAEEVRTIISFLLTPGLDTNIDRVCVDLLTVPKYPVHIGIHT